MKASTPARALPPMTILLHLALGPAWHTPVSAQSTAIENQGIALTVSENTLPFFQRAEPPPNHPQPDGVRLPEGENRRGLRTGARVGFVAGAVAGAIILGDRAPRHWFGSGDDLSDEASFWHGLGRAGITFAWAVAGAALGGVSLGMVGQGISIGLGF